MPLGVADPRTGEGPTDMCDNCYKEVQWFKKLGWVHWPSGKKECSA